MTKEQGNKNSIEAQELRRSSEYLKQVVDFVEFMQKEHIDGSTARRSLIVAATDDSVGGGKTGEARVVVGDRRATVVSLAGMMHDEQTADIFHDARILCGIVDERTEQLPVERRRLRTMYFLAALCILWSVCVVALWVMGSNWMITISNLLLMAVTGLNVFRDIRDRRRRIESIKDETRRDRQERTYMMAEAFMEGLKRHIENMRSDDDDDE